MRKMQAVFAAIGLAVLLMPPLCAQSSKDLKGQDPPPLTVSEWINSEKPVALADFLGKKVVLLEFFMVKCPHCVAALPQLRRLHDNYTEDGLVVISVATDPPDKVKQFVEDNEIKSIVGADTNFKTTLTYGVEGVPWSFLIGASGKVVWQGDPRALDDIELQSELVDLPKAK